MLRFTRVVAVMLSAALVFVSLEPVMVVGQSQQPTQQTVAVLAQQTQTILPTDPRFPALLTQFSARIGLSGPALTGAFVSQGLAVPLGNGMSHTPLVSAEGLDVRQIASGQIPAALLGILTVPQGATLAGVALPQRVGVAAMTGSLVLVLIDLATGNVLAFLIVPEALILTFAFFPVFVVFQVIVQLVFIPTIFFPFPIFPIFPIFLACPALPNVAPITVAVGSGATLVTVQNGGNPVFQIREGLLLDPQPSLRIVSFGASLQYTLLSAGSLTFGFVGGGSTGRARLPLGIPFRLLVQGGGKTACLQAAVISFGFGLLISGTVAFN
jgi:hypothetical protein